MRKPEHGGSILVLVLGIVLVISSLTISFLHIIESEVNYISQIDPNFDSELKNDSTLSIIITNLYSYLMGECSFRECQGKIRQFIGENFSEDVNFTLIPEDGKISLKPEFLPLLEQLFLAIGLDRSDSEELVSELEEFFDENKLTVSKLRQLLALPRFERIFVGKGGYYTERWRKFTENVTCQGTEAVAIPLVSDELLLAICATENWHFDGVKAILGEDLFLDEHSSHNIFAALHSHGFSVRNFAFFKGQSSCFNLTISQQRGGYKLAKDYFIRFDISSDWHGFPFTVTSRTNKL